MTGSHPRIRSSKAKAEVHEAYSTGAVVSGSRRGRRVGGCNIFRHRPFYGNRIVIRDDAR